MTDIALSPPPGYEYTTTGPWWVAHISNDGRPQAWVMWTFESAVIRFWAHRERQHPQRRVMIDAMGVTVLGIDRATNGMVGTRETMEQTMTLAAGSAPEDQVEILAMVERLRQMNGSGLA